MQFNGLRVCVVGPKPPPAGGMANQAAELCRLLRAEGACVTLVATNPPYVPALVGRLKGVRALFRLVGYALSLKRAFKDAQVIHLMANSGWSWHLFAAPALWIAHWCNVPLVVNYRGGHASSFFDRSWAWIAPSMRKARAFAVPSPFLADIFAERGITPTVIPNTLDPLRFHPGNTLRTAAQRRQAPLILITRNLEAIYGIDIALQALDLIRREFTDARLIIAGCGPEERRLRDLCAKLELNSRVEFCGRLQHAEIAPLYQRADLLLNPSRIDNSPNSIIEALGCGLPVVSTNVGGIPKLVTHRETAILVEAESASALAQGITELLDDDRLYQRLRENGIRFSARFHWDNVKLQLQDLYQRARSLSHD